MMKKLTKKISFLMLNLWFLNKMLNLMFNRCILPVEQKLLIVLVLFLMSPPSLLKKKLF